MSQLKNLTGQTFGSLRVVERGLNNSHGLACWWCECQACHDRKRVLVQGPHLRRGHTRSCGCIWAGAVTAANQKRRHGFICDGYRRIGVDGRYMFEHRIVVERDLGRALESYETIHHKNGNRTDNRLENLEVWNSQQPHGQRVEDKVAWAVEILRRYAPELLVG